MSSLLGEARVRIRPDTAGFLSEATRNMTRDGKSLGSVFGKAMKTGAVAVAGITAAAAVAAKSTLDIGVTYQNSLNTLKAVSKATEDQMASVGRTAKTLGSDITLPATSAADAAAAMTELAKAGFTVEQSQTAAKGSLQLAAAAQVDAATAANIQAGALNAFGLQATDATHVADVLANASNASAAEITDVAYALQAGSSVAASAKIPIEDYAAAVGILANNAIVGSDAGTLLKSAILALQSPSGPASKAMDALGLSAYDAAGNFVGLESIFGQLSDASKTMTQEQYDAATSTLFGSDAARLAGIAAKTGADGFREMADTMGTAGAAADVAAAKSQGVGGAIEAFKSQVETFQIDLFERAAPNIEKLVRYAATNFPKVGEALMDGAEKGVDFLLDLKDKGVDVFKTVAAYVEPVTSRLDDLWGSLTAANGPADNLFGALKIGGGILLEIASALKPVVELGGDLIGFFSSLPGPIQTAVLALAALKAATSLDLLGKLAGKDGIVGGFGKAGESAVGFTQTVRANMKLAGDDVGAFSKVTDGLGAGFQTYMPGATSALKDFSDSLKSAFEQAKENKKVEVGEQFGTDAISAATGDIDGFRAAAREASTRGVGALRSAGAGLVGFMGGPFGLAMAGGTLAVGAITSKMAEASSQTETWSQSLMDGGKSAADALKEAEKERAKFGTDWFGNLDYKASAWAGLTPDLEEAKEKAKELYDSLSPLQQAQQDVTKATNDLTYAVETYGLGSPEAVAASDALAGAHDKLAGKTNEVAEAAKTATQKLQEQTSAALAGTNADIAASMATTSLSSEIDEYRKNMADASLTAAQHTQASDEVAQQSIQTANALAQQAFAHSQATNDEGKQAEADAALLKSLQDTATQLGDATPESIKKLIASMTESAASATTTSTAMSDLGLSVVGIPDAKTVIINAPTAEQEQKLKDLGYTVEHLPNGQVKVTTDLSKAELDLASFINKNRELIINSRIAGEGTTGGGGTQWRRANGGPVFGPGTSTSDSISALLSNGEFVVKAASVAKYGYGFLDDVNAGRFAEGGLVGASRARATEFSSAGAQPAPAQAAPLVGGDLVLQAAPGASVHDQMGDAMFELRRLRRGGRL